MNDKKENKEENKELSLFCRYLDNLKHYYKNRKKSANCELVGEFLLFEKPVERFYYEGGKDPDIVHKHSSVALVVRGYEGQALYNKEGKPLEVRRLTEVEEISQHNNGLWFLSLTTEEEGETSDGLDDFFDENATVYQEHGDISVVLQESDREERVLAVRCALPPKALHLKYDTFVIDRQLFALRLLKESPAPHNSALLKLTKPSVRWEECIPAYVDAWEVLKDTSRKGVERQREFVRKALGTKDFALMEGPAGSGKTTCIVELIHQILKRDLRAKICLTASTHVAVDNVLERLEEAHLPILRVGKADRVGDTAKGYTYEEVVKTEREKLLDFLAKKTSEVSAKFRNYLKTEEGEGEFKRFIEDTTNIVCSTAPGIPNYEEIGSFYYENKKDITTSAPLLFDYLILDEASKTTIHEFLLPAVFAERFIIIGDRRQLSPYIEDRELSANLSEIRKWEVIKKLSTDKKEKEMMKKHSHLEKFCEAVDSALLVKLADKEEILKRPARRIVLDDNLSGDSKLEELIRYIKELLEGYELFDLTKKWNREDPYELAHLALADAAIGFKEDFEAAYLPVRDRESAFYPLLKLKDYMWPASAQGEIAWRRIREYELRQMPETAEEDETGKRYLEQANRLALPKTQTSVDDSVRISTASILESLQEGYRGRAPKADMTALRNGLGEGLKSRFTVLEYQYRMKPEIADFPSEIFYGGEALKSDNPRFYETKPFFQGKAPLIWQDVPTRDKCTNENEKEVEAIKRELEKVLAEKLEEKLEIAVLTFYRKQERKLSEMLQKLFKQKKRSRFEQGNVKVKLCTVDRFQGQEADMVLLSLTRNNTSAGFLNSPNRLNVALTRAKQQLVIFGNRGFFVNRKGLFVLNRLAQRIGATYSTEGLWNTL